MAEIKTKANDGDVMAFLESVEHKKRREDGLRLYEFFKGITDLTPVLWGNSIVGKHKISKGCLYINKLEDIDLEVLKELISKNIDKMTEMYG